MSLPGGLRAVLAGVAAPLGLAWLCRARRGLGVSALCAVPAGACGVTGLGSDRPVPAGVRPLCWCAPQRRIHVFPCK